MVLPTIKTDSEVIMSLRKFQLKKRHDCHAAFITYEGGTIWPFTNFGKTRLLPSDCNLYGRFPVLDEIARIFLDDRPEGGRFFISKSRSRVFTKDNELAAERTFLLLDS